MESVDDPPAEEADPALMEVDTLSKYVRKYLDYLAGMAASETGKEKTKFNRFETILAYGNNADRLRLLLYIFSHHIALSRYDGVHLFRTEHYPNLVRPEQATRLLNSLEEAHYLQLLEIRYITSSRAKFVAHLLALKNTDTTIVPGAILIDDIANWMIPESPKQKVHPRNVPDEPPAGPSTSAGANVAPSPPPPAAEKPKHVSHIFNLYRLCAFLLDTVNGCAEQLKPPELPNVPPSTKSKKVLLIVTLDLNHFYNILFPPDADPPQPGTPEEQEKQRKTILDQLVARYFKYSINVDAI